jgi:hypothetical protein
MEIPPEQVQLLNGKAPLNVLLSMLLIFSSSILDSLRYDTLTQVAWRKLSLGPTFAVFGMDVVPIHLPLWSLLKEAMITCPRTRRSML